MPTCTEVTHKTNKGIRGSKPRARTPNSPVNKRARGSLSCTQLAGISHYLAVRSGRSVIVSSAVCPRAVSTQPPTAARQLTVILDKLRSGSARVHRGRLAVVRAMSTADLV